MGIMKIHPRDPDQKSHEKTTNEPINCLNDFVLHWWLPEVVGPFG